MRAVAGAVALWTIFCLTGLCLPGVREAFGGEAGDRFRRLVLDGQSVRWAIAGSARRVITVGVAAGPASYAGAVNCTTMASPDGLLAASQIAPAQFEGELDAALAMWSAAAPIAFTRTPDWQHADIVIGAQGTPDGYAFTNVFRASAQMIARATICLNPDRRWKIGFDGDLSVFDLRYTLAHEIGHALGLDHPARSGVLMAWHYDERFRDLQQGDVEGIEALYGRVIDADGTPSTVPRHGVGDAALQPTLGLATAH
jgi:hypothetical protein